ncbi:MAG: hypothetical protein AABW45_03780 [Nanoarchaeota archaeon]
MPKTSLVNIVSGSRWDGSVKHFTELCNNCEFYRKIKGEDRCYWGIAYKLMGRENTLSYCQLINKQSPRKEALRYSIQISH